MHVCVASSRCLKSCVGVRRRSRESSGRAAARRLRAPSRENLETIARRLETGWLRCARWIERRVAMASGTGRRWRRGRSVGMPGTRLGREFSSTEISPRPTAKTRTTAASIYPCPPWNPWTTHLSSLCDAALFATTDESVDSRAVRTTARSSSRASTRPPTRSASTRSSTSDAVCAVRARCARVSPSPPRTRSRPPHSHRRRVSSSPLSPRVSARASADVSSRRNAPSNPTISGDVSPTTAQNSSIHRSAWTSSPHSLATPASRARRLSAPPRARAESDSSVASPPRSRSPRARRLERIGRIASRSTPPPHRERVHRSIARRRTS